MVSGVDLAHSCDEGSPDVARRDDGASGATEHLFAEAGCGALAVGARDGNDLFTRAEAVGEFEFAPDGDAPRTGAVDDGRRDRDSWGEND